MWVCWWWMGLILMLLNDVFSSVISQHVSFVSAALLLDCYKPTEEVVAFAGHLFLGACLDAFFFYPFPLMGFIINLLCTHVNSSARSRGAGTNKSIHPSIHQTEYNWYSWITETTLVNPFALWILLYSFSSSCEMHCSPHSSKDTWQSARTLLSLCWTRNLIWAIIWWS